MLLFFDMEFTGLRQNTTPISIGIVSEEWAQNLIPCDMEGFCINEDGNLLLMDECGNYAYCPEDRFQVNFEFPVYSKED